jgi:hypothetical protein
MDSTDAPRLRESPLLSQAEVPILSNCGQGSQCNKLAGPVFFPRDRTPAACA